MQLSTLRAIALDFSKIAAIRNDIDTRATAVENRLFDPSYNLREGSIKCLNDCIKSSIGPNVC